MSARHRAAGRRWAATAAALCGVLSAACGTSQSPSVDFSVARRDYSTDSYPEVWGRWTRHGKVLHELESALEVWATYKSPDFREAFVARYAENYRLNDEDRQRLRAAQRESSASSYEFEVTAQSASYRWNDLEKKSSAWRISLIDAAGHALSPEKVTYEKLPEMYEREFYPVKTPFTRIYIVRFPRPGAPGQDRAGAVADDGFTGERSGKLILRFAGPFGSADLTWTAGS